MRAIILMIKEVAFKRQTGEITSMKRLFECIKNLNWAMLFMFVYIIAFITYQIVVVCLKANNVINWEWWVVFIPLEFCGVMDLLAFPLFLVTFEREKRCM